MALNPQLVNVATAYTRGTVAMPSPFLGESVYAARDGSHFRIDGPRMYKFSGSGTVYLTNFRLVFVPNKPTATVRAIELPLLYIQDEKVSQPIFGANNLSGVCIPVDAPPNSSERIKFKLCFTNGGMGTLVPLFYATINYLRVSSRRQRQEATPSPPPQPPQQQQQPPPSFVSTALVDPNDPTKIFLTQPVLNEDQKLPNNYPII